VEFKNLTDLQLNAKIQFHKDLVLKMEEEAKSRKKPKRKSKELYFWDR
jgi:hypothetical protein